MIDPLVDAVTAVCRSWLAQVSIVSLITLYLLVKFNQRNKMKSVYRSRIEDVRKERDESIEWAKEQSKSVGEDERMRIEAMDFKQLREALQSGKVTAETVVRVYYGLAAKVHEKTNCLTTIVRESLVEARSLDEKAKERYYQKPRLFGIPLSVKEQIEVAGQRNTWGVAKRIDCIPKEDSLQVAKLRKEGMVPFCLTNVPTLCMTYMCDNSIYGTTTSPHSPRRTSGGSSGGEGAIVGGGGSICGLGSDLGGSVRIPAAFCGCSGFKSTPTRISTLSVTVAYPMRPMIRVVEGPLAKDPHAIVEMMRSMWSDSYLSDRDPFTVPMVFNEEQFKEGTKYRIGYYTTDGYIDPLPGNQRVVSEAVELLKAKGHTLVPFSMEDIVAETARGLFAFALADGGKLAKDLLKDEPLTRLIARMHIALFAPFFVMKFGGWFCRLLGDRNTADFLLQVSSKAIDVQDGMNKVLAVRKRLAQKMNDENIDVLLCPSFICPAPPHSMPGTLPHSSLMSTMMWNAMEFPAGVVTTSSWTEKDEADLSSYPAKGLVERTIKCRCKKSVGLPLSVQIVAPAYRDEMVLRVMVDLYDALKKN